MEKQATINIGTLGHVSHGKSTLVQSISSIKPMKFSKEQELSLTIKLGYANFKIYKCDKCPIPRCYYSMPSNIIEIKCPNLVCDGTLELQRHMSFIDCPGHDCFMATMMSGASVMDAAILVIAANQSCPQPQTSEHLAVAEMLGIESIIVVQNKVDLLSKEQAMKNYREIKDFLKGTIAENSPIIPTSCVHKINLDVVLQCMCTYIKEPNRNIDELPLMNIIRSFDINKCGTRADDLKGGVAGGTLKRGRIKIGQEIEIRPGIMLENGIYKPLRTVVESLHSEKNQLDEAKCGGLIGIGTLLDPFLTQKDKLQGQIIGISGFMPDIYLEIHVKYRLMKYLLSNQGKEEDRKINKIKVGEKLQINCGSLRTLGLVSKTEKNNIWLQLERAVSIEKDQWMSLSRLVAKSWRLIGYAIFIDGIKI